MIHLKNYVLYFSDNACPGCKYLFVDLLTITLMCICESKELPILDVKLTVLNTNCSKFSKISDWDKPVLKFKISQYENEIRKISKSYFK
jgi:hypothetical protein